MPYQKQSVNITWQLIYHLRLIGFESFLLKGSVIVQLLNRWIKAAGTWLFSPAVNRKLGENQFEKLNRGRKVALFIFKRSPHLNSQSTGWNCFLVSYPQIYTHIVFIYARLILCLSSAHLTKLKYAEPIY